MTGNFFGPGFGSLFGGMPYGSSWHANQTLHGDPFAAAHFNAIAQQNRLAQAIGAFYPGTFYPAIPEPDPVENTGIELGEVEAWRCWNVKGGFLTSLVADNFWAPGEVMEGSPGRDTELTGVNAFKKGSQAIRDYGADGTKKSPRVVGRIALWGEVVEHQYGYRAEFGIPLSLDYIIPDTWRLRRTLRRLREKYDLVTPG